MLIKFSKKVTEKSPGLYDYIQERSGWRRLIKYVLDRRYREAVNLRGWLEEQVSNPSEELLAAADEITDDPDTDGQAVKVLKFVEGELFYVSDQTLWGTPEKWSTAHEALQEGRGDCEDGAILAYVLCRLKGIPANRLLLVAGDVENPGSNGTVGHCWLAYRPTEYPLNFVFLDWSYYYTGSSVESRNKYYVSGKSIKGWSTRGPVAVGEDDRYKNVWFLVNEEKGFTRLDWRI